MIFIAYGSDPPPPLKSDNQFFGNLTNFKALLKKSVFFPLKTSKHLEKFQKIATGHAKFQAHCSKEYYESYLTHLINPKLAIGVRNPAALGHQAVGQCHYLLC